MTAAARHNGRMPGTTITRRVIFVAFAAGLFVLPALPLCAQHSRPAASRPTEHRWPWKIEPPVAGAPCPSWVEKFDTPADCLFGMQPLATSRPAVTDGDTIRLEGQKESLRLIGLDAEETFKDKKMLALALADWDEYVKTEMAGHQPSRPPKYGTFMGEAAKDFAEQFFRGVKDVRVEWDDAARKIDVYGRHLVLVFAERDGHWVDFNVEVVRQGLSPYFVKYGRSARYHAAFAAAQKEAQDHQRGIWANPGIYRHYADYALRLAWWGERDLALTEADALRKTRQDLFILGHDADWQRLLGMEGKTVTVFGSPGEAKQKGGLLIQAFPHGKAIDFDLVGSPDEVEKLGLKKEEGNLLYVTGKVELYNGRPQFRAADPALRIARQPPH